jgi:hypothetical protein
MNAQHEEPSERAEDASGPRPQEARRRRTTWAWSAGAAALVVATAAGVLVTHGGRPTAAVTTPPTPWPVPTDTASVIPPAPDVTATPTATATPPAQVPPVPTPAPTHAATTAPQSTPQPRTRIEYAPAPAFVDRTAGGVLVLPVWQLTLADGTTCTPIAGTSPSDRHDAVYRYGCSDRTYTTEPDRTENVWSVQRAQIEPSDLNYVRAPRADTVVKVECLPSGCDRLPAE